MIFFYLSGTIFNIPIHDFLWRFFNCGEGNSLNVLKFSEDYIRFIFLENYLSLIIDIKNFIEFCNLVDTF